MNAWAGQPEASKPSPTVIPAKAGIQTRGITSSRDRNDSSPTCQNRQQDRNATDKPANCHPESFFDPRAK
jgi:hypothetical protein